MNLYYQIKLLNSRNVLEFIYSAGIVLSLEICKFQED